MTQISQVDQALLLLREQLQRMSKTRNGQASAVRGRARSTPSPLTRLAGLASLDDLPEDRFRRTLVRALLTEELGDSLANEPVFQAVIDDVFRIIDESDEGRALLAEAALQVRGVGQPA